MAAPDGPAQDQALVREPNNLRERVERLEAGGAVRLVLDRRLVDEGVARAVQSIGVVVDHPAERRLIDRADLRKHVEANFRLTEASGAAAMPGAVIDIHGWLIWAEARRFLRYPVQLADETTMAQEREPRDAA